jgi:hypothetical protein
MISTSIISDVQNGLVFSHFGEEDAAYRLVRTNYRFCPEVVFNYKQDGEE